MFHVHVPVLQTGMLYYFRYVCLYVVHNRIIHVSQFPLLMVLIFNDQFPIDKISDLKSLKQRKNAHLVQSVEE